MKTGALITLDEAAIIRDALASYRKKNDPRGSRVKLRELFSVLVLSDAEVIKINAA